MQPLQAAPPAGRARYPYDVAAAAASQQHSSRGRSKRSGGGHAAREGRGSRGGAPDVCLKRCHAGKVGHAGGLARARSLSLAGALQGWETGEHGVGGMHYKRRQCSLVGSPFGLPARALLPRALKASCTASACAALPPACPAVLPPDPPSPSHVGHVHDLAAADKVRPLGLWRKRRAAAVLVRWGQDGGWPAEAGTCCCMRWRQMSPCCRVLPLLRLRPTHRRLGHALLHGRAPLAAARRALGGVGGRQRAADDVGAGGVALVLRLDQRIELINAHRASGGQCPGCGGGGMGRGVGSWLLARRRGGVAARIAAAARCTAGRCSE
jgi:hypothetical protein